MKEPGKGRWSKGEPSMPMCYNNRTKEIIYLLTKKRPIFKQGKQVAEEFHSDVILQKLNNNDFEYLYNEFKRRNTK